MNIPSSPLLWIAAIGFGGIAFAGQFNGIRALLRRQVSLRARTGEQRLYTGRTATLWGTGQVVLGICWLAGLGLYLAAFDPQLVIGLWGAGMLASLGSTLPALFEK